MKVDLCEKKIQVSNDFYHPHSVYKRHKYTNAIATICEPSKVADADAIMNGIASCHNNNTHQQCWNMGRIKRRISRIGSRYSMACHNFD